ncbi:MAG TPA: proline racemase family protein [Fimbriimonas sp.]|nr:proline racemase family protein [Fimbriimonas sp.]
MTIRVIDSHTGGEPTRVVMDGWPLPEGNTLAEKAAYLGEFQSNFRTAIIHEPRGHEVIVGALLVPPCDPSAQFGVIFFNNEGVLGMCGHGLIGLIETLRFLDQVSEGTVRVDTPVGVVEATLSSDGAIEIRNVESFRYAENVSVQTERWGTVKGDVAYGGNWFFLVKECALAPKVSYEQLDQLMAFTTDTMEALANQGITGADDAWINHVEVFTSDCSPEAHSKNYVLCPGKQYDRSPCGTGTSAKVACLAADGKLQPGEVWKQESIIGSIFEARYEQGTSGVTPFIKGKAFVTSEAILHFNQNDPFIWGIN